MKPHMDKDKIFGLFLIIEQTFWIVASVLTIAGAFGMLIRGGIIIVNDMTLIKEVLRTEFFYAVICFELTQMARIRLMRESHRMVLYHFVFMATLTFGREIFLIHNLNIWIAIGFTLMVGIYIVFYAWSHEQTLWHKTNKVEDNKIGY